MNSSKKPVKVCFVGLYAYSLFNRKTQYLFGGSEVRGHLFATALAKFSDLEISYVVFDHGQEREEVFEGVRLWPHSYYRTYKYREQLAIVEIRQFLGMLRRKKFPPADLIWRVLSQSGPLAVRKILRRFAGRILPARRPVRIGQEKVQNEKYSIYERIGADIYCSFGVSDFTAEIAAYCKWSGKKFILFAGSDDDLSAKYYHDSRELNSYGSRGDRCFFAIMNADQIVAQTLKQADLLKVRFGRSSKIIPNPIDLSAESFVGPTMGAREFILWVGKSDNVKRPDRLLEIATAVPEIPFVLVMNQSRPDIHSRILATLPSNVRYIESLSKEDVEKYFSKAIALVNTSVFEGFPNTFLQAGKYGVPVVSSEVDPDGFLERHGCGVNANRSLTKIVETIRLLTEDAAAWAEYSRRISNRIRELHDLEKNTAELREFILQTNASESVIKIRDMQAFELTQSLQDRYLTERKPLRYEPHPVELYERLIELIQKNSKFQCPSFVLKEKDGASFSEIYAEIYFRHDIDTRACAENMWRLLDIDLKHRIPSGIYIRVDDVEYRASDYKSVINKYRNLGFEVGLHTVCYLKDDYLGELRRETEKFSAELGFAPASFTVHGLGKTRVDVRHQFYKQIAERLPEFGFRFSDCHPSLRHYKYVIEDCHLDKRLEQRFIYEDFDSIPDFFERGSKYLVLTHPCYWRPESQKN